MTYFYLYSPWTGQIVDTEPYNKFRVMDRQFQIKKGIDALNNLITKWYKVSKIKKKNMEEKNECWVQIDLLQIELKCVWQTMYMYYKN
jgi:hypothetical protein